MNKNDIHRKNISKNLLHYGVLSGVAFEILLLTTFLLYSPVFARSGCCSWHGGVCGCGCCDGTPLSSTCAPYYPECYGGGYYPPVYVPQTPQAPKINASFSFDPNPDGETYTVHTSWTNVTNTGFSLSLHKNPGGDPGPLTDTMTNSFTFYNVEPGTWYMDMKVGINHVWSNVIYWEVDVPPWTAPLPTTTPTPTFTQTEQPNSGWIAILLIMGIPLAGWLISKITNNTKKTE